MGNFSTNSLRRNNLSVKLGNSDNGELLAYPSLTVPYTS